MLNVCLLLSCVMSLYEGHVQISVWPPRHKIIVEGDPCSEIEDVEKASSIRFESAETEASSSSQPAPAEGEASSSSSAPLDRAEQIKELANVYAFEDKLEEAIRCYSKAIQINPSVPKYYRNRGLCFSRQGKIDSAILDYRTALDLEPESVRGLVYLARAFLSNGDFQEAKTYADEAFTCGEQQELIDQVMYQVTSLQENIQVKLKKRERARQMELYNYLSGLITKDMQRKIEKASPDTIDNIKLDHDEYQKELKAAFPITDEEQQTLSSDYEYLRDKIDFEIMKDPVVVVPSGITYERVQIMKHLEERQFDPATRAPLHPSQLRPNKLLKEVIDAYNRRKAMGTE